MEKPSIPNKFNNDHELDKWIKDQFKQSMVEPPHNFSEKTIAKLVKPSFDSQPDPILLIVLVALLMICTCTIVFSNVFPEVWNEVYTRISILDIGTNFKAIINTITGVVIMGLVFFSLDYLLMKKIGKHNLANSWII